MAKAAANTKGCNCGNSDEHNERKKHSEKERQKQKKRRDLDNPNTSIRKELTKNNSSWKADDVPSLWQLDQKIRKDYAAAERTVKMKDGTTRTCHREMPSKGKTAATPVKETVMLLPTNGPETDAMVEEFARRVEELTGWRCVRWFVHRDERYDDPDTKVSTFNNHAHLVWDCYDWKEHQIRSVGKAVMRQIQDIAAEVTGMERGTDARITHAEHLSVSEFKNEKERQRAEELKAQNLALQEENVRLQKERDDSEAVTCANLQRLSENMVQQFDSLAKIIDPTEKQRRDRDKLDENSRTDIAGMPPAQLSVLNVVLHQGLDAVAAAVGNLTQRIIELAKQVPLLGLRSKRLKHEAQLQKAAADARQEADNAISDAQNAISEAEEKSKKASDDAAAAVAALKTREDKAAATEARLKKEKAAIAAQKADIDAVLQDGYQQGYAAAVSVEKSNTQKLTATLRKSNQELTLENSTLKKQVEAIPDTVAQSVNDAVREKDIKIASLEKQLQTVRSLNASYERKIQKLEHPTAGVKIRR